MRRFLLFLALLSTVVSPIAAQDKGSLTISINKGIGLDYHSTFYYYLSDGNRHRAAYSAGGGMGADIHYEKYLNTNLSIVLGAGYQQILAPSADEDDDRILASFNYQSFSLGPALTVLRTKRAVKAVSIGVYALFSNPGRLRRTEEDLKMKPIKYNNSYGWEMHTNFEFDPLNSDKVRLISSVSYRSLRYNHLSANPPANLRELNGNSILFSLGIRTYLSN